MKRNLTALVALAIVGCVSLASAQGSKPTFLTNGELKALLSKKLTVKVTGTTAERPGTASRTGTSIYEPDGTARLNEGNVSEIGSWRIEENRFCTRFSRAGNGCYNVQKTGAAAYNLVPT